MTEPADLVPPPRAMKYALVDYAFQFIIITVGVLVALLANGLVEWNNNRQLMAQARATIAREIADNKKDLDSTLAGTAEDVRRLDAALKFANEMLTLKKTAVTQLQLHVNLADLSATAWRTAERTGALSHMPYAEVQKYSKLYDIQDLFVEQQRTMVGQLGAATAILGADFDPDRPNTADLVTFRERLMLLRAALLIQEQLGKRLAESYGEALR